MVDNGISVYLPTYIKGCLVWVGICHNLDYTQLLTIMASNTQCDKAAKAPIC